MTRTVFDLADVLGCADPYPFYAALRESGRLVRAQFYGNRDIWCITRFDDVREALSNPDLSSNWRQGGGFDDVVAIPDDVRPYFDNEMVTKDGAEHARLRRAVSREFTARRVAAMRTRTAVIVNDILDAVACRPQWDVVTDVSSQLPVVVLSELLGVEPQYQPDLADHVKSMIETRADMRKQVVPVAARALVGLICELIERRRARPGPDLLSALVVDSSDDRLNENELVALVMLIVRAGYETTGNTIATGVLLMLKYLDIQQRRGAVEPERISATFEEIVRFSGPAEIVLRFSVRDTTVGAVAIPAGATVAVCCGAANRDPRRFEQPDLFMPWRSDAGHVGFGYGPHFCLGAALARVEGEEALQGLFGRHPDLALAVDFDEIRWLPSLMRGVERLPVAVEVMGCDASRRRIPG